MAVARNGALLRRVIDEILNAGDLDLADALLAPTYINHNHWGSYLTWSSDPKPSK